MAFHVPTSSVTLLRDPPFVLLLILLGTAIGYRLLVMMRLPLVRTSPMERGLLSAAMGMGLLQYLAYAFGMTGHLTPGALGAGLGMLCLLFAPDMFRVLRGLLRSLRHPEPAPRWILAGLAIVAVLMATTVLLSVSVASMGDDGYHLTAPKRWLQAGSLIYLPSFTHTQAPMGVEMLYTVTLALWSDTAAGLLHATFSILALICLYALGCRLRNAALGFATVVLWIVVFPVYRSYVAFVDMAVVFEVFAALLAWIIWIRGKTRHWLTVAALCAGFAASFKLTALLTGLILSMLALAEMRGSGITWKRALRASGVTLLVSIVPVLPWLYRTWILTGNPVYPMLPGIFPTRDWSPETSRVFEDYFRLMLWAGGRNWSVATRSAIRLLSLCAFAILGILLWNGKGRERRSLVLFACLSSLVGIYFTGLYLRFLFGPCAIAILALLIPYADRIAKSRAAQAALLLIIVFITWRRLAAARGELILAAYLDTGNLTRAAFFEREKDNPYMLWDWANRHLPPDARILSAAQYPSCGSSGGNSFFSDRYCYVTDAHLQYVIRLDAWPSFLESLRTHRIGYLFMMDGVYSHTARQDTQTIRNEYPFSRRLATEYGHLIARRGHYQLYRLDNLLARAPEPGDAL